MNYSNTTIELTINLEARLATRGKYELSTKVDQNGKAVAQIERNADGKMEKSDITRLKTIQLPRYHRCELHTTLGESFCAFAVSDEARPKKTIGAPYWNRLSPKNRLEIAVKQYVSDLYGDVEYSFQILGE